VLTCVGMIFTLGLLMAPPLPEVDDARSVANREHDRTIGIGPGAQAVSAVLAADRGVHLSRASRVERPQLMTAMDWRLLEPGEARTVIESASNAQVGYAGVQRVTLTGSRDHVVAQVKVAQIPGRQISMQVLDARGQVLSQGLMPSHETRVPLPSGVTTYRQGTGGMIAGQSTVLVEALRGRQLVARWWLAPELGLIMWNETFDSAGRLVRSAGFEQLTLSSAASVGGQESLPLQLSQAPDAVSSPTRAMCSHGFTCAHRLAGLPLAQITTDSATDPSVVHAVYRRGSVCVTVLQRRGKLVERSQDEYGVSPDRTVITWQSGAVVYTVTTNEGPEIAQRVASELPHARPVAEDPLSRSWSGLKHLIGPR